MFFVYILRNGKGKHYIGMTNNLPEERLKQHNHNKNRSTKNKGPWQLVYIESFPEKKEAFLKEKQIKSYKGGKAFQKLLEKVS